MGCGAGAPGFQLKSPRILRFRSRCSQTPSRPATHPVRRQLPGLFHLLEKVGNETSFLIIVQGIRELLQQQFVQISPLRFPESLQVSDYFLEDSGGIDDGRAVHFFLDGDAETDPAVRRLQDLLRRKVPAIRALLRRLLRDDSDLPEYMDRIYGRVRGALGSDPQLDEAAIWRRAISIIHEDRRRAWRLFADTEITRMETADPESLDFVTALVRRDQLKAFRDCLDEWTRQAFDLKYSSTNPGPAEQLAKRFGITRDAFYQRWKRGLAAGREEYRRRYGDLMP